MKKTHISGFASLFASVLAVTVCFTLVLSKEPAPKKINAKLGCSFESQDGTIFKYPGNGSTMKPRLEGALNCWISIPEVPEGVTLKGTLKAKGKQQEAEAIPRPDDTYSIDATFTADNGDFDVCAPFTVTGEVKSAGKSMWKGKLAIDQSCPD